MLAFSLTTIVPGIEPSTTTVLPPSAMPPAWSAYVYVASGGRGGSETGAEAVAASKSAAWSIAAILARLRVRRRGRRGRRDHRRVDDVGGIVPAFERLRHRLKGARARQIRRLVVRARQRR